MNSVVEYQFYVYKVRTISALKRPGLKKILKCRGDKNSAYFYKISRVVQKNNSFFEIENDL